MNLDIILIEIRELRFRNIFPVSILAEGI